MNTTGESAWLHFRGSSRQWNICNVSKNVQEVSAANTVIQYSRKKSKYKVILTIPGPTDQILKVVVSIFLLGIVDSKLISDFICAFPVKVY